MNSPAWRRFLFLAVLVFVLPGLHADEESDEEKGIWIDREHGERLNLLIEERKFELHFYDEEGEAIEPDATQAIIHYSSRTVRSRETIPLSPVTKKDEKDEKDEKTVLTSPRLIRPPYQFEILLVLNFDEAERETESHHVIFQQEADPSDDTTLRSLPGGER